MSCSDPDTVAPAPVDDTNNDVPAPADNPLKRKTPPTDDDDDDAEADPEGDMDPDADADADAEAEAETEQRSFTPGGEYESGRVSCDTCGLSVSFRDEETGGFSLKQWQEHKESCGAASGTAVPPSPMLSTLSPSAHPPAKRRRAKRTEEERKAYLGSDPYVERFEAYRVLCKSCDKWIRLRPNSTYCSIPWDAHRKSCLAKKMHVPPITTVIYLLTLRSNSKNVYALEERNALFSKDPDVRKFDAERVLCNLCDNWLPLNPDNHLVAVQAWLQHRAACQHARPPPSASPKPEPTPPPSQPPNPPSPPFHDLNPANYAPAHESRRRNAEQRAATLRADSLIAQVEPNRVFCSLCQKWVQLRQDSSYCAYPWLQHRGKCLARHQRRAAKAAEVAEAKARKLGQLVHPPSSSSAHPHSPRRALRSLSADLELESEDERVDIPEDVYRRQCERERDRERERERDRARFHAAKSRSYEHRHAPYPHPHSYPHHVNGHGHGYRPSTSARVIRAWNADAESEARARSSSPGAPERDERERERERDDVEADADGERETESRPSSSHRASVSYPHREREREAPHVYSHGHGHSHSHSHSHGHGHGHGHGHPHSTHRRPSFAPPSPLPPHPYSHPHPHPHPYPPPDLDTPPGRRHFVLSSITYLRSTTYEPTDEMSVSALVAYLNAAVPVDKYEDFDTGEVVRVLGGLRERGRVRLEGDLVWLV